MGIKEIIGKLMRKKQKMQEYEEDLDVERKVQQKKLSANERELNRFLEEEREEKIKQMLDNYRKKRHDEVWHGKNMLQSQNVVRDNKEVIGGKQLFTTRKNKTCSRSNMFFQAWRR